MRQIDLTDYQIPRDLSLSFNVRESLAAILFNDPDMTPRELIARDTLARRVEACQDEFLLLEEADHAKFVAGLNGTSAQQLTRDSVEFVRRVLDAPTVDVVPKPI